MEEIVKDYIYPMCAIMITIGIWLIAIELERIRKIKQSGGVMAALGDIWGIGSNPIRTTIGGIGVTP